MIGDFSVYYLNQSEFRSALEMNKRFKPVYGFYAFIRIKRYFDHTTFEGNIAFADYNTDPNFINQNNELNYNVINDYYANRSGAFTFDGINFFKILNLHHSRPDGMTFFTFKFIDKSTFEERNSAFMIMPFQFPDLNNFYQENIREYLKSCDLEINVYRSDDFTGSDIIADTILDQIRKAEFIICDITNQNKNVFFEIGFAKGIGKDIIFLLEENKPADFFDVNHIRRLQYSYNRLNEFQELLKATLLSIRANRPT